MALGPLMCLSRFAVPSAPTAPQACHRKAAENVRGDGGAGGIRTLDTVLPYTHFPGERLRPLGHRSACAGRRRSSRAPPSGQGIAVKREGLDAPRAPVSAALRAAPARTLDTILRRTAV